MISLGGLTSSFLLTTFLICASIILHFSARLARDLMFPAHPGRFCAIVFQELTIAAETFERHLFCREFLNDSFVHLQAIFFC
jgi:hypothetical protein